MAMTFIDRILFLLKDGESHSIDWIESKSGSTMDKLKTTIRFLADFGFITLEDKKVRITSNVKNWLLRG